MDIVQLIGFIIAMAALFIITIVNEMKARRARKNPEQYQKEKAKREENLRRFLKGLNTEMEDERPPQPPIPKKPKPKKNSEKHVPLLKEEYFRTSIEHREFKSAIDEREFQSSIDNRYKQDQIAVLTYNVIRRVEYSRANKLIDELPSKKRLVLYQAIMGKPKGLGGI